MLTRVHPLISLSEDLEMLQRQLDRAFEPRTFETRTMAGEERAWALPMELTESQNTYKVRARLPGLHPEQVEVTANHKTLTIEGEWTPQELDKDEKVHLKEFSYGKFRRSITFNTPIVADKIEANYTNGILTLVVPKEEAAQNKVIKVNVS